MSLLQTAALVGSLAASVSAHGYVQGIVAAGTFYTGYSPSFQYASPPPTVIGWSDPEDLSNGFIDPSNYTTPEIICHLGATPGGTSAPVAAGDTVELQWTPWPDSHHGPVLTYLANCNGKCETVDKTTLEFVKIDEVGLISDADVPGTWASDQLIANNNSWVVTIPKSIKAGNYVMRHEIIALHSAETLNGAQNYPQCINLEITGSGTDSPAGTLGEKLYSETAPGISIDIYESLSTYIIPGPTLYSGAVSMVQTEVPIGGVAASATAAASAVSSATSAPVSTSAAPTSTSISTPSTTSTSSSISTVPTTSSTSSSSVVVTKIVTTTTSSSSEVAPVSTSAPLSSYVAPSATASFNPGGPIANITSGLPSGALTSIIPTALPSGGAFPTGGFHHHGGFNGSAVPTKPLPEGFTLQDLLEWVDYLMRTMFKDMKKEQRFHPRDIKAWQ